MPRNPSTEPKLPIAILSLPREGASSPKTDSHAIEDLRLWTHLSCLQQQQEGQCRGPPNPHPLIDAMIYSSFIHILHWAPLFVTSRRCLFGVIRSDQSRHATGPPNPSADYFLVVVFGEVRGHDKRTKGEQSRSSGAEYVSLQIARIDFDFPAAPSGDGTRDNDRGLAVACGGMGGPCRSVLGGGDGDDRIRAVPATESSLLDFVGAPLLAAAFYLRAVRNANAPLDGSVGAHPSWLHRFTLAPCVKQTPPMLTPLAHPSWQRFTFAPRAMQTPPLKAPLAHPSWLHRFTIAPCVTTTSFRGEVTHTPLKAAKLNNASTASMFPFSTSKLFATTVYLFPISTSKLPPRADFLLVAMTLLILMKNTSYIIPVVIKCLFTCFKFHKVLVNIVVPHLLK